MLLSEYDYIQLLATRVFVIVGFLYILKFLLFLIIDLWTGFTTYLLPKLGKEANLCTQFGSWAVVTGSTDGVGKAYAMELAKRGVNICLISRSEEKLIATASEIEKLYYGVQTKWIKADFSKTDVYDHIREELSQIKDIGILVNNVGIAMENPETFASESEEFLWRIININIGATVLMTSIILPIFLKQKNGLIVNLGSQSGIFPVPLMSIYSSTKAFVNMFSTNLKYELENDNIRVQCLTGGWIDTKLLDNYSGLLKLNRTFIPWIMPKAQTYAASAVRTLSSSNNFTCGYWFHSLFGVVAGFSSNRYIQAKVAKIMLSFSPK